MQPSTPPSLKPRRIIVLLLIAAAVLGLAYLRFEHGTKAASVPTRGEAGQLRLSSCTYVRACRSASGGHVVRRAVGVGQV
jgi:hypothetical protein